MTAVATESAPAPAEKTRAREKRYYTDGKRLIYVVARENKHVRVEDCGKRGGAELIEETMRVRDLEDNYTEVPSGAE